MTPLEQAAQAMRNLYFADDPIVNSSPPECPHD